LLSAPTIVIVYFALDWKFVNAQVSDVKAAKILFQFLVGQKKINPAIFRKIINPLINQNFSQPWLSQKLKNNFMLMPSVLCCLQCFDAVGWAAGRASGL